MAKRYSKQFKDDAVKYRNDHPEVSLQDTTASGSRRSEALALLGEPQQDLGFQRAL